MHKALHPKDDVDRLYVPRKEGRRGLASIEDSVDTSIQHALVWKTVIILWINMPSCGICPSGRPPSKFKRNRKDRQIMAPCQRTAKSMGHEWQRNTNCSWCTQTVPTCLENGLKRGEISGKIKAIPTTVLLRLAWILRKECLELDSWERPSHEIIMIIRLFGVYCCNASKVDHCSLSFVCTIAL